MQEEKSILYSFHSASFLIGCLLNKPELLLSDKYKLEGEDFSPILFHRILFFAIRNLLQRGVKELDEIVIDVFLQNYEEYYEVANDNNFMEVITNLKELSLEGTVDYHYDTVRKFSLLRFYKENKFDISHFYDESKENETETAKLDKYTLKNIIDYFESFNTQANKKFVINDKIIEYKAGNNFLNTMEKFENGEAMGGSFQLPELNSIFNGMYGFILRSGDSGDGKTVASVGDLMKVSATHYWDDVAQDFIANKSFMGGGLLINTEMQLETELDPMLIAWIANVDRGKIRKCRLTDEEKKRVKQAREILNDSPVYLVDDPQFTAKSLITTMRDYVYNKDIINVCFDYISNNGYAGNELANESKIPQREDMILQTITDRLKQEQRSLGVGLLSGTQTNGKEKDLPYPNASCLAGGKSQVRKVDGAMIMMLPNTKELESFNKFREIHSGFNTPLIPNRTTHIIKGRNNEYDKHIKVLHYLDTGTCRDTGLLVLNKDNFPIDVEKLIIES